MTTSPLSLRKGTSRSKDAVTAAKELYEQINQSDIKLAVFYCSPAFDLPVLERELARWFKDINLIGCTTAGEITPIGYLDGTLTGVSIASPEMDVCTQMINLQPFEIADGEAVVTKMIKDLGTRDGLPASPVDTFAFLLIDGLSMQEEMVVSCVHEHLHGIELIGGSAADDVRFSSTHLYYQGKFHQHVALLTLARSQFRFMAFRTQHFVNSDKRMVVTRADPTQRIVYEINGMPAGREFARLVGLQMDELTPLIFATYPVVVRVGGEYFVRSIAKVNPDESLVFFCAIDEGIVLTIAKGIDLVENLATAFSQVRDEIGDPQLVLGCDCILRRLETERTGVKEAVGKIFADNNVIGFATYGEQFNSMHVNQTFTGIAIGSRTH